MSLPAAARPHGPLIMFAFGLATLATVSTGFAVWMELRMAEAHGDPIDVAALTAFGVILGLALLCLTRAAIADRRASTHAQSVSRRMTWASLAGSGLVTLMLGPWLLLWLASTSWPLSIILE